MKVASVNGVQLSFDDEGRGRAIILLHAFPLNRKMWTAQLDHLRSRYRVISPDFRGFGDSSSTGSSYEMEDMARDIAALMDFLQIDRATLMGLSMGGYAALAFYRHFPLRVRSLVLADTRAGADSEDARKNREILAEKTVRDGMKFLADSMLPKLLSADTQSNRSDLVSFVRDLIMENKPEAAAAALRAMGNRKDHTNLLSRIVAPTLVIVGREDSVTPIAEAELFGREIRGSRVEIIDGAGHLSNIEKPAEFNSALDSFLKALEP
jgi:3-oxoadipate enol-lactonase